MKHETQTRLIDELLALIESGQTGYGEGETHWPVEHYCDPRRFERELPMLAHEPLPIAHSTQLARPGDFVAESLFGQPVVVVRTQSGAVTAFLNVCRHRGAELVGAPAGNTGKTFVCPYHAWTYDLEGTLTHVPDREGSFPNLACEHRNLVPLPAEERHGLVWIVPSPDAVAGEGFVERFLGADLDSDFEHYGFDGYVFYREERWQGHFNWKCAVESFLENYHFAVLHKHSTDPIFVHNVGICERLESHFRALSPKKSIRELRGVDRGEWNIRPHATILTVVSPFSIFFIEKSHYSLLQIVPETVDTCNVKATHVVAHDRLRLRPFYEANIGLFMAAIREDLGVCESMHRGFRTRANRDVVFGRNEVGCDAYRNAIEERLASWEARASNGSRAGAPDGVPAPSGV